MNIYILLQDMRFVKVWVESTFRGKTFPEPIIIERTSYKTDFRLIPKDEEQEYCKSPVFDCTKIVPKTMEFPPLLKELLIRNAKAKGNNLEEEIKLEIFYNKQSLNMSYKIAKDGEKPTVEIVSGLGKPVSPRLYEGLK